MSIMLRRQIYSIFLEEGLKTVLFVSLNFTIYIFIKYVHFFLVVTNLLSQNIYHQLSLIDIMVMEDEN